MSIESYACLATIENDEIVIRVPFRKFQAAIDGYSRACGGLDDWKVTDAPAFANAVLVELNAEDEEGTTPVHRLFDNAINEAIEQGAAGIEEVVKPKGRIVK